MLTLLDSSVEALFCDMPDVTSAIGRFILIGLANVAELEAGLISERTKAGLAIPKQPGVRLASTVAKTLEPIIRELQRDGCSSFNGVAAELKNESAETRSGAWRPQLVKRTVHGLKGEAVA